MNLRATFDTCVSRSSNLQTIEGVTLDEAVRLVDALDGSIHTEVLFELNKGTLTVSGGSGQYFVSAFTEDEESYVLPAAITTSTGSVKLTIGGQPALLPSWKVVSRDEAIDAIRSFTDGTIDFNKGWKLDE